MLPEVRWQGSIWVYINRPHARLKWKKIIDNLQKLLKIKGNLQEIGYKDEKLWNIHRIPHIRGTFSRDIPNPSKFPYTVYEEKSVAKYSSLLKNNFRQ